MKTAFFFAGRHHHYERLWSTFQALSDSKQAEPLWLAADNMVNNDPATEYLIPAKAPHVHLLDYLTNIDEVSRRTEIIVSQITKTEIAQRIPWSALAFSAREASEVMVGFDEALAQVKPALVIVLHENNFWTKPLAYLCHERGIPVVGFQEGLLRHRDQATQGKQSLAAEYLSHLLVWSEAAQQAYIAAGIPASKMTVTGIPHLDQSIRISRDSTAQFREKAKFILGFKVDRPLVVCALPQSIRYEGDLEHTLQTLLAWSIQEQRQLALRLHPFDSGLAEALGPTLDRHPYAKLVSNGDLASLLLAGDVILTQHTTAALEALALGRPVLELDLDNVGVLESIADQGAALRIGPNEMEKISQVLSGELQPPIDAIAKWRQTNVGPDDGRATERVMEVLETCLK